MRVLRRRALDQRSRRTRLRWTGPEDGGIKDGRQSGLPLTLVPGLGQQGGVNDVEVDVILDKDHWLQIVNNNPAVKISQDQLVAFAKLLVSRY